MKSLGTNVDPYQAIRDNASHVEFWKSLNIINIETYNYINNYDKMLLPVIFMTENF